MFVALVNGSPHPREDVLQDAEGLQIMRNLGLKMAWMLKCINESKALGIPAPPPPG